mgnify:FL=1|nr:MAG TPA: hypothetical protein [Bacteriophage sp.]
MELSENIKSEIVAAVSSRDFKQVLTKSVVDILNEQNEQLSKVSFIERQKLVQSNTYKSTERLLYNFNALKEHLENETEYLDMAYHKTAGSIVKFQKNKVDKPTDDQLLQDRIDSYRRSLHDFERIKKSIDAVSDQKGFEIIRLKYLTPGNETVTYEGIAEQLAGTHGFSDKLNEKTVRRYKNLLINKIATLIFGSDAI